LRANLNTTYME